MKLEMGESLILSWLRHIKKCQIVQTNWKPSKAWNTFRAKETENFFLATKQEFGENVFKKSSQSQLMQQAEIDALGIILHEGHISTLYAVDIAYHESGLNYGSAKETIDRITKKMIRTAMVILNNFDISNAEIIFASPKINPNIYVPLLEAFEVINEISTKNKLGFQFILSSNEDFYEEVLNPTVEISKDVSDTSELFLRSVQLLGLSEKQSSNSNKSTVFKTTNQFKYISEKRKKKNIKYTFIPSDEEEFKKLLISKKRAYIKIIYENGTEELKPWKASNFNESSGLRSNINSKTWFRSGYKNKNGECVVEGVFSIEDLPSSLDKYRGVVSEEELDYGYKESREAYLEEK